MVASMTKGKESAPPAASKCKDATAPEPDKDSAKNPFPNATEGLCPNCLTGADVSAQRLGDRNRTCCSNKTCKSQTYIANWFCVRCSNEANSSKDCHKEVIADCVCYAKSLFRQGKSVLCCPHVSCKGWKAFDKTPVIGSARIACHTCQVRRPTHAWQCFGCNMDMRKCLCDKHEKPAKAQVRKCPAQNTTQSLSRKK